MASSKPKALSSRPLDLLYTVWFIIHLLITLLVDLVPFYPTALQFPILLKVAADYARDFKDPLVINRPPWFVGYLWIEGLYQAPLCVWAVMALKEDRPTVPVHLLVYAVQTAITTITCLIEVFASVEITWDEKVKLSWLYGAWAVVPGLLGLDMFLRIRRKLIDAAKNVKQD